MKTKNIFYALLATVSILSACKKEEIVPTSGIIPTNFMVEIPSSLNESISAKMRTTSNTSLVISGDTIYKMLRTFVHVGHTAAHITNDIMQAIANHNLSQPMSFSFTGDDGNQKDVVIVAGSSYDYEMTIKDGGNYAMQVFWNLNAGNGVEGFSIINPYELDHTNGIAFANTKFRIDYSEVDPDYDKQMLVQISNWPMSSTNDVNNLKMFVGKTGNILDIYGNSNHPNAVLLDTSHQNGFEWAFRAHSDAGLNIAVAEVGLPTTIHSDSTDIFSNYSIHEILDTELHTVLDPMVPVPYTQSQVDAIINVALINAVAPGYFAAGQGFVKAGTPPVTNNAGYLFLENRMNSQNLYPYIPSSINNLSINWQ